jgi:hypothetical protein
MFNLPGANGNQALKEKINSISSQKQMKGNDERQEGAVGQKGAGEDEK